MANIAGWRAVSRSLIVSKKWKHVPDDARVLWLSLLLAGDSYGTIDADPEALLDHCFPNVPDWDAEKVENALASLADAGLVVRWQSHQEHWVNVVDFDEHQHREFIKKRGERRTPEPPTLNSSKSDVLPTNSGVCKSPANERWAGVGAEWRHIHIQEQPIKNERVNPSPKSGGKAGVGVVFAHWKQLEESTVGKTRSKVAIPGLRNPKQTQKRSEHINARLSDFSAVDICNAITAYFNDPWFLGENKNDRRYTDLHNIIGNTEKVERGLVKYQQQVAAPPKSQEVSRVRRVVTAASPAAC